MTWRKRTCAICLVALGACIPDTSLRTVDATIDSTVDDAAAGADASDGNYDGSTGCSGPTLGMILELERGQSKLVRLPMVGGPRRCSEKTFQSSLQRVTAMQQTQSGEIFVVGYEQTLIIGENDSLSALVTNAVPVVGAVLRPPYLIKLTPQGYERSPLETPSERELLTELPLTLNVALAADPQDDLHWLEARRSGVFRMPGSEQLPWLRGAIALDAVAGPTGMDVVYSPEGGALLQANALSSDIGLTCSACTDFRQIEIVSLRPRSVFLLCQTDRRALVAELTDDECRIVFHERDLIGEEVGIAAIAALQ